jgi:MFS family permease
MRVSLNARLSSLLTLSPQSTTDPEIARNFRRNFIVIAMDMMTWSLGASFVAPNTILTVFASRITQSTLLIGLIPALLEFGIFVPPLFVAPYVERLRRKFPLVLALGTIERYPYALLPLAAIWLTQQPEAVAVPALLLLVAFMALGSGIVTTPWQEMVAKVIPVTHRGRLFGIGHFMGQLLSIAAASLAAAILASFPFPQNFAISFAVGSVFILISLVFLMFTVEPERPVASEKLTSYGDYFRRVGRILRTHKNYRLYIFSRWLIHLGRMPMAFVAIFAVQKFNFPDASAAVFAGILAASGMLGYAVWGVVGDRWGHKRVLELATIALLASIVVSLLVALTGVEWALYVVFALMGLSNAGNLISSMNLPLEFGPESERPTYIGLTRTAIGPVLLIAPLLGGFLIQAINYPVFFLISGLITLAGLVLLRFVQEPRRLAAAAAESVD